MRAFLWFTLFRKRTESRLSFFFFFFTGKFKSEMTHVLAYFHEISPFIVLLFLLFVFLVFFFYGKVQVGDDSCTGIFSRNTPFYCLFIMFLDFLLCISIFRQLTLISTHLLYFERLCFYADAQQYIFCLFLSILNKG